MRGALDAAPWAVAMLIALAGFAAPCLAETYAAKVVGITDGDTVMVLDAFKVQHKIRLSGIDSPASQGAH